MSLEFGVSGFELSELETPNPKRQTAFDGETMNKSEKMAPHNTEAEEAALGSLLLDPDAIFNVASFLSPADFYREKNG